jgi:hypothetical protein
MRTFLQGLDGMYLATVRKQLHTCSKCIIMGSLSDSLLFTHDAR